MTPNYTIGVWAGNAQGQGVPGLTGARTAGPVLFELLGLTPASGDRLPVEPAVTDKGTDIYSDGVWFREPLATDGARAEVCAVSGSLKGLYCDAVDTLLIPKAGLESEVCPYHEPDGSFLLPPAMEWYYRQHHPEYHPPVKVGQNVMEFIYPERGSTLWLPRQLDGRMLGAVFQLAHRDPSATVYWHMDGEYLGETRFLHRMQVIPEPGEHSLTVVDGAGNTLSIRFQVAENQE